MNAHAMKTESRPPALSSDQASQLLKANEINLAKKVTKGLPLSGREVKLLERVEKPSAWQ